jgi:ubiquitin carboxyl-terminal hydrolase 22/27/51
LQLSKTKESFSDISLSIPKVDAGNLTKSHSVESLLSDFLKEEHLQGEEGVVCDKCSKDKAPNTKSAATKKFEIIQLPNILVFHVKRFTHSFIKKKVEYIKDNGQVSFPLLLDSAALLARRTQSYTLFAVVEHRGCHAESGHYVSYIYLTDKWFYCSDTKVVPVDSSAVANSQAYLLFYRLLE